MHLSCSSYQQIYLVDKYKMASLRKINFEIIKKNNGKFCIKVNNKLLKTPKENLVELPNFSLAKILLQDYKSKIKSKDVNIVSAIKITNTAIDKIKPQNSYYIDEITNNLNNDVLCYFSSSPEELVNIQNKEWLPLIHYMKSSYDIDLTYTSNLFAINQKTESLSKLKNILKEENIFRLSAFYTLSQITKSIIIPLALVNNKISAKKAFENSNLEELYQISKWGKDEEAFNRLNTIKVDIRNIKKYYDSV
ncbi:MAG: hypothetical protein CMJ07_07830 [Pelagibacterales bacterium]|nr:hypothetical protein [Pelagibacterales bacterium]OUV26430.1 MAG: hypothetical protein CBC69_05925 [Alphaproteobacteria bacterium TMED109]|tara:strand:+ start:2811 stop:3560 length:750 start_codon:yes stop_codon:yes gene_type:complete